MAEVGSDGRVHGYRRNVTARLLGAQGARRPAGTST